MDSDWDFLVALATASVVIASVVLVYMLVTYARTRAATRRLKQPRIPVEPDPNAEPVFFRRYTGEG